MSWDAWRRRLFADWQLKMGALLAAVGLWMYVHSEQRLQLTVRIPLELRNPPRAQRLARKPPASVEVRLEADRELIPKLTPEAVRAVVDLTLVAASRRADITLTPDHILRPVGVAVLSIAPSQLVLEFEPSGRGGE